jgi:hypothetical protein
MYVATVFVGILSYTMSPRDHACYWVSSWSNIWGSHYKSPPTFWATWPGVGILVGMGICSLHVHTSVAPKCWLNVLYREIMHTRKYEQQQQSIIPVIPQCFQLVRKITQHSVQVYALPLEFRVYIATNTLCSSVLLDAILFTEFDAQLCSVVCLKLHLTFKNELIY